MSYKFEQLLQLLRSELKQGNYPPGSRFPSASELALRFDINRTTANKLSLVLLNDGFLQRTGCTRTGFVVTAPERQKLSMNKIALIGTIEHPFFAHIAAGFFAAAYRNDCLAVPFAPPFKKLNDLLRKLESSDFRGIATYSFGKLATDLPVVYLEPDEAEPPLPCVGSDTQRGGQLIVDSLWAKGHREIVFCFSDVFFDPLSARICGMLEEAKKQGLKDMETRIFWYSQNGISMSRLLREMMTRFPRLTAIVTDSDDRVWELIRGGKLLGIAIPEQIAVCGFGNVGPIQNLNHFPTIDQHPFDVGNCGCEVLLKLISEGRASIPDQTRIDVELLNAAEISPL